MGGEKGVKEDVWVVSVGAVGSDVGWGGGGVGCVNKFNRSVSEYI